MNILKFKKKMKTYYTCCKESLGMVGRSYAFKYTDLYNKRWTCE